MRKLWVIAALALLTGCDAGTPAADAVGGAKTGEIGRTAVGFAQCMRDRGYQVPDPTFNEDGLPVFDEPAERRAEPDYQKHRQECRAPLNAAVQAAGVPNQKGTPDQWLAFARCMREHGVDMADPTPDNRFMIDGRAYDSPAWQPAAQACGHLLPPAMRQVLQPPGPKGQNGK